MNKQKEEEIDKLALRFGIGPEDYAIYRHFNKEWYVSVLKGENQANRDAFSLAAFSILRSNSFGNVAEAD